MATQLTCKRCGRKLKRTELNVSRGYGSVCWEKEGKYATLARTIRGDQNQEIADLRKEVRALKVLIAGLTTRGNGTNGTPQAEIKTKNKAPMERQMIRPQQKETVAMMGNAFGSELMGALKAKGVSN